MNIDRRKIKTQKAIKEAFVKLAGEKLVDKISVKELTEVANISRKTFYLNYKDIEDFINQFEDDVVERLVNEISKFRLESVDEDCYPLLYKITQEFDKTPAITKFFIESEKSLNIFKKFKKALYNTLEKEHDNPQVYNVAITFTVTGIFGAYEDWYLGGKKITLENLCSYISKLVNSSIKSISNTKGHQ